jgi:hypothetical protein
MNWTTVLVFPGPAAVTLTFVALSVRPCGCSCKSVAISFVSSASFATQFLGTSKTFENRRAGTWLPRV